MVDMPPRIDAHSATTRAVQYEWRDPLFSSGLAFVSDLGCLDATDAMPAGSVRQWRPTQPAQSLWLRGYQ